MINPNYMTHLDHVVRIIIVCRVLTEKMRSGKFQASVASYIESYNTQRPHRTLKNLTPCQVEENSIEKAEWDIRVRTAWFFRFLCQIEAVWVFVSHIYLAQHFQKNAVMPRLSEYKTAPPNSQVSSTCSNWVGSFILVPVVGLEPTRCRHQRILSPSRLPFHHTGVKYIIAEN